MYEKETDGSNVKEFCYIAASNGTTAVLINHDIFYLRRNAQGSVTGLTDQAGNLVEEFSYDSWGRRRDPLTWHNTNTPVPQYMHRGYIMQEHMDEFDLINLNGRIYDPVTGQFLSPDPIRQTSGTQELNAYSYCLNNPLKYKDPNGLWANPLSRSNVLRTPTGLDRHFSTLNESTVFFNGPAMNRLSYWHGAEADGGANGISSAGIGSVLANLAEFIPWFSSTINLPDGDPPLKDVTEQFNATVLKTQLAMLILKQIIDPGGPASSYVSEALKVLGLTTLDPAVIIGMVTSPDPDEIKHLVFALLTMGGGILDLKSGDYSIEALNNKDHAIYMDKLVYYEDFGNYNFGVAARAFGIPLINATAGAGINELGNYYVGTEGKPDFSNYIGFFDSSPYTTKLIIAGYLGIPFYNVVMNVP